MARGYIDRILPNTEGLGIRWTRRGAGCTVEQWAERASALAGRRITPATIRGYESGRFPNSAVTGVCSHGDNRTDVNASAFSALTAEQQHQERRLEPEIFRYALDIGGKLKELAPPAPVDWSAVRRFTARVLQREFGDVPAVRVDDVVADAVGEVALMTRDREVRHVSAAALTRARGAMLDYLDRRAVEVAGSDGLDSAAFLYKNRGIVRVSRLRR